MTLDLGPELRKSMRKYQKQMIHLGLDITHKLSSSHHMHVELHKGRSRGNKNHEVTHIEYELSFYVKSNVAIVFSKKNKQHKIIFSFDVHSHIINTPDITIENFNPITAKQFREKFEEVRQHNLSFKNCNVKEKKHY